VDRIVTQEVPVPVDRIVERVVEVEVQKVIEKEVVKYVDRYIDREVIKYVDRYIDREVIKEIPVDRIVIQVVLASHPVLLALFQLPPRGRACAPDCELGLAQEVPVYVDRVVEKIVEVPVDRIVERIVEVLLPCHD
jgi:hypothetical protein